MKAGKVLLPAVLAGMSIGFGGLVFLSVENRVVGAALFTIGAYFPGFTQTAFLTGLVFGLFLHKKQGLAQSIAAVGINQFILSLLLNTLWISVLYGSPYGPLLLTRLVQAFLLFAVQLVCIQALAKLLKHRGFMRMA